MIERDGVSRRAFLRRSSCAARASGPSAYEIAGPNGGRPFQRSEAHPEMAYRRLGKTNLMVSEIVLGGHFNDPAAHRTCTPIAAGVPMAEAMGTR